MKIGIVGYGTVGSFLHRLFSLTANEIAIYDKFKEPHNKQECKLLVNRCDIVFVSVPTPACHDGKADISAVHEAISWITPPTCIKSTVPPGTTQKLTQQFDKPLIVSPEYVGESAFHPYRASVQEELVILGGDRQTADLFMQAYALVLGPETKYFITDSITAELTKYMENCFFATKVAFVAQFHSLARMFGADFHQMREMWVADSRIGRSHSMVVGSPGFGGRCLPKDLSAIIHAAENLGGAPLLKSVRDFNALVRYESSEVLSKSDQKRQNEALTQNGRG